MPRTSRKCPLGFPVHVIQRGNNRQPCFTSEADLKAYAHWLHEAALKFGASIHAWSSYRAHALGCDVKMWTPHAEYLELGPNKRFRSESYRQLFRTALGEERISEIRLAAYVGLGMGDDKFKEEVERLSGQRQHHLKRDPKPQPKSHPKEEFLL